MSKIIKSPAFRALDDAYQALAIGFQTVMSARERTSHVDCYDFGPSLLAYHQEIKNRTVSSQQNLAFLRLNLEERTANTVTDSGESRGFLLRDEQIYEDGIILSRTAVADFYGLDSSEINPKFLDIMKNGATRPLRFVVGIEGMPVEIYFKKYSPVRVPHSEIHNMLSGLPRLNYKTDGEIILEEAVRGFHKKDFERENEVSLDKDLEFLIKRAQGLAYAVMLGTKDLLHGTPRNPRLSSFNDRNYKVTSTKSITLFDFDKIGEYSANEIREVKRMLLAQGLTPEVIDDVLITARSRVVSNLAKGDNIKLIHELSEVTDSAWDWLSKKLGENPTKFVFTRDFRMIKEYFSWFLPRIEQFGEENGC